MLRKKKWTWDSGGAVNEGEDHATEGPSDSLNTNGLALGGRPEDAHDG